MKSIKQAMYKLIVSMCVVLTLCSFLASTPVYASKVSNDFYYSGTSKGSYTVEAGLLEKLARLIPSIDAILDFLLGMFTMGFRIVIVGWTALFERALTWILLAAAGESDKADINSVSPSSITTTDEWVTLDAIFFNRVPLFDINFFKFEVDHDHSPTGVELSDSEKKVTTPDEDDKTLVMILKKAIAGWYYVFRAISLMLMLVILVYIGVKLAINSATKEKALYKKVLMDWVVGMILVFSIHYIMLFMINLNEILVDSLANLRSGVEKLEAYEYGNIARAEKPVENDELEVNLYDEVRTRAYDAKLSVGTTGMIMYMVLVFYAWKYSFIYLKRYLTVAVLTMVAPLMAATYAFNKVNTGKSAFFSKWFKEYLFIVLLQTIHCILYLVFLDTALRISLNSVAAIILVFCLMNMMSKSEGLFRKIFGIESGLINEIAAGGGIRDAINDMRSVGAAMVGGKLAKSYMKTSARVLTKPVRALTENTAGKLFAARMLNKANRLDEEERKRKITGVDIGSKRAKEQLRLDKIRNASLGHALASGSVNLAELEESVKNLEKDITTRQAAGKSVGKSELEYLASEKKALQEFQTVNAEMKEGVVDWEKEYKKMTSNWGKTKQFIGRRWSEIMDPYQYLERDSNGKWKVIDKARKDNSYETAIGKALFGGKVQDSAAKRIINNLKPSNLLGLNKEEKEAMKAQMQLTVKGITGFFGIMAGLPLLVAEPKFGAAFLYKGVDNLAQFSNPYGRRMNKIARRTRNVKSLDPKTRYILTGFEGASIDTIAAQAKLESQQQVKEIAEARAKHDKSIVQQIKNKHPKLAKVLKSNRNNEIKVSTVGHIAGASAVGTTTVSLLGMTPLANITKLGLAPVAGLTAPATLSVAVGSVMATAVAKSRVGENLWFNFQSVARASRQHNSKVFEAEMKDGFSEDYIDKLADQYYKFDIEHTDTHISNATDKIERDAQSFGAIYAAYLTEERERIDNLTNEELQLENGFQEELEFEKPSSKDVKEKQKLTAESERALIDNAILETAKKLGIMDLKELEKDSAVVKDVAKQMTDDLKRRGIIKNSETVDILLDDIESKVKDRAAILSAEGTKPMEQKLTDEAIVEAMKKGDSTGKAITDPTKVDTVVVEEIYQSKISSMAGVKASEESASVLSSMQKDKGTGSAVPAMPELKQDVTRVSAIEARKTSLADRARKPIDKKTSKTIKEQLKKKMEVSIDTAILQKQEQLDAVTKATKSPKNSESRREETEGIKNLNGILINEAGGLGVNGDGSQQVYAAMESAEKTDRVLQLLDMQTKMHKEKVALESYVSTKKENVAYAERRQAYVSAMMSDGTPKVRVSQTRDGSRRVGGTSAGGQNLANKNIDDLLKTLKSNMQ